LQGQFDCPMKDLNQARITVYCASSAMSSEKHLLGADQVAASLVEAGASLVYGGGKTGLMGRVADAVLALGGKVQGVMPAFLFANEVNHPGLTELIQVDNMRERKHLLMHNTEGIIALPGGCGTLEELMEAITLKRLGQYLKPVVIVNQDGFYDPLIEMFDSMVSQQFMRPEHLDLFTVVTQPADAIDAIRLTPDIDKSILQKATYKTKTS